METEVKLTKLASCAGCGAKVGAGTLRCKSRRGNIGSYVKRISHTQRPEFNRRL